MEVEAVKPKCIECSEEFEVSYLFNNFGYKCCNSCRDLRGKHEMIKRTDATRQYLLTVKDLDEKPELRGICSVGSTKPKYYLKLQIEECAVEKWGSLENIRREQDSRRTMSHITYVNRSRLASKRDVAEKVEALSKGDKSFIQHHYHMFREKVHNAIDNTYSQTCFRCGMEEICAGP